VEDLRKRILEIRRRSLIAREELRPSFWTKRDRTFHGEGVVAYAILDTGGCRWATESGGCSMCGYVGDSCLRPVNEKEVNQQVDWVLTKLKSCPDVDALKIFTSGSFFDQREIPLSSRSYLMERLSSVAGLREVTVESRPEYISRECVRAMVDALPDVETEVALGLESSSDWVRNRCIGKGFGFEDFRRAATWVREAGARVKTYVLLKPPFLSEFDSHYDSVKTVEEVQALTDSVSINACNVQRGTLVEELHRKGEYRPPWIWTVIQVLQEARDLLDEEQNVICDTVAFGTERGPHNCKRCDKKARAAVERFSLTQDASFLEDVGCSCRGEWAKIYNYHF